MGHVKVRNPLVSTGVIVLVNTGTPLSDNTTVNVVGLFSGCPRSMTRDCPFVALVLKNPGITPPTYVGTAVGGGLGAGAGAGAGAVVVLRYVSSVVNDCTMAVKSACIAAICVGVSVAMPRSVADP